MITNNIQIGTSGFSYKDWLGNFYPQFCPPADFLKFYNSKFKTVELDSTFYRIPTEATVRKWAKISCEKFIFSAKFPNKVTHEGEIESRINNAHHFINVMKNLGPKLGPLLLQFPYSFKPDRESLLSELISELPSDIKIAVELRNKQWLDVDSIFDLFKKRNIAFCLIDHPWMPRKEICTADFHYIRFLGDRKKIDNDFSYVRFSREEDIAWWGDFIAREESLNKKIYAYFNNHYSGHAPSTAYSLIEKLSGPAELV